MIDEDFDYFLTKFPHTAIGPTCTQQHIDTYTGLVPEALITYWREYGFAGFGDGIIWLTDPLEWQKTTRTLTEGVVHPDLGANATYIPFARTAFGDTQFWTPGFGISLTVDAVHQSAVCHRMRDAGDGRDLSIYFASAKKWKFDLTASGDIDDGPGLFDPCLGQHGPVAFNQVYGFLPALALGGKAKAENVVKFELHVHLEILRGFAGDWDTAYLT